MFINKQSFSYILLIIFSVYCTGIIATDCDVYKKIIGNDLPYKLYLDEANGNCCAMANSYSDELNCDSQNNIIYM